MNLKEQIENYKPYNEQEEKDKETILKYINTFDDVLTRNNEYGHFTASSWAVNKERTKVLMIYHNIYKSWAWTGGHADGESDLLGTAIRELKEETGITKEDIKLIHLMNFQYATTDMELEVYFGNLNKEKELIEEVNKLYWIDKNSNFFDINKYAGEGNIGHMLKQVDIYNNLQK